jgi:hypothetical protein
MTGKATTPGSTTRRGTGQLGASTRLTPQPHIWPGRNIGLAFGRDDTCYLTSRAVCLVCDWVSPWHHTMTPTHKAGWDHRCYELTYDTEENP